MMIHRLIKLILEFSLPADQTRLDSNAHIKLTYQTRLVSNAHIKLAYMNMHNPSLLMRTYKTRIYSDPAYVYTKIRVCITPSLFVRTYKTRIYSNSIYAHGYTVIRFHVA